MDVYHEDLLNVLEQCQLHLAREEGKTPVATAEARGDMTVLTEHCREQVLLENLASTLQCGDTHLRYGSENVTNSQCYIPRIPKQSQAGR